MEWRTLLLELIAMLTLLTIAAEGGRRDILEVWYHSKNNSITWTAPMDVDKLVGYTVYRCLISSGNPNNCDERETMQSDHVNGSRTVFQFMQPMAQYRMAVVATYSEGVSGDLKWSIKYAPPLNTGKASITWTIVGCAILAFLVLCWIIIRKLRHMSDISVELPDFYFKDKPTFKIGSEERLAFKGCS